MGYILSLTEAIDIILFWWGFLSSWVCSAVNSGYNHLVPQIFDVEIAGVINFVELYFFHLFHHNSAPTPTKTTERTSTHPQGFLGYLFFFQFWQQLVTIDVSSVDIANILQI